MKFTEYEYPELRIVALRIEAGYAASGGNECEDIENGGSF